MNNIHHSPTVATAAVQSSYWGWVNALIATFALSVTAPMGRVAILAGMHPTSMAGLRFGLAWLLLAATLRIQPAAPGALRRFDRRALWMCLLSGTFSGAASVSYAWALNTLNASISAMLVNMYPLVVVALLALRGEKLTRSAVMRLALGLSGVYLILGPSGQANWVGAGLSVFTAISFATSLVINQWYLNRYPSRLVTFYVIGVNTLFIFVAWMVQGLPWSHPGLQGWLALIVLAVLCTFISRLTMFRAIQQIGSSQVALLAPLETLLTVMWSVIFLRESLNLTEWLGGALVVSSLLLAVNRPSGGSAPGPNMPPPPAPHSDPARPE